MATARYSSISGLENKATVVMRSISRMRKNAVLATHFVEFSFETRAVVAENRVLSRLLC